MAYKVLSLKWRPQTFKDVVGQDHIIQTLINAFDQDRIAQGYIFTGPRGVGKTTTARILAMAMNADGGPNSNFDPNSEISNEISEGRSMDVLEIDGASNRGIEEIRGLREQIKFSPMNCSYKVVIIDEVHMLTNQAFNALLRTLEEPPSHGKFIFATTDIHKVPATIISRCQRFDFNRISLSVIAERIKFIIESEGVMCDSESIHLIAKKADGSMRDALSILDQSISYCGENIVYDNLTNALGVIDQDLYFDFTASIREKDYSNMMVLLSKFSRYGVPASEVLVGMEEHIRNLVYASVDKGSTMVEMNKEHKKRYVEESQSWERRDLFRINQILIDTSAVIRRSDDPYLLLEMTTLKLLEMDRSILIDQLLSNGGDFVNENNPLKSIKINPTEKRSEVESPVKPSKEEIKLKPNTKDSTTKPKEEETKLEKSDKPILKKTLMLEIDKIKNAWPKVLDNIQNIRPTVGAIVEDFAPCSIEEETVFFESNTSPGFNEKLMERGIPIVAKELSGVMGMELKVNFKNINNVKRKSKEKKKDVDNGSNPKDEKVLNKIVDLFDGEIIQ